MPPKKEYLWAMRAFVSLLAAGGWTSSCSGQESLDLAGQDAATDTSVKATLADAVTVSRGNAAPEKRRGLRRFPRVVLDSVLEFAGPRGPT